MVYVWPFGALMTRLLLVMLFTGPMKEIPPGLNATVEGVEVVVGGCVVAVGATCVAGAVVGVVPDEGCVVLLVVPPQAESNTIITSTTIQPSRTGKRRNGMFRIVLSVASQMIFEADIFHGTLRVGRSYELYLTINDSIPVFCRYYALQHSIFARSLTFFEWC